VSGVMSTQLRADWLAYRRFHPGKALRRVWMQPGEKP
jgi:hypothetical protein